MFYNLLAIFQQIVSDPTSAQMNPLVLILSNSLLGLMESLSLKLQTTVCLSSGQPGVPKTQVWFIFHLNPDTHTPCEARVQKISKCISSSNVCFQGACILERKMAMNTTQNTTNHRQAPPPTGCGTECLPHAKSSSRLFQSLITGINKVHPNESKPFPQSLCSVTQPPSFVLGRQSTMNTKVKELYRWNARRLRSAPTGCGCYGRLGQEPSAAECDAIAYRSVAASL